MTARCNNLEHFVLYPACLMMFAIDPSLSVEHDTNQWKETRIPFDLLAERGI